MLTFAKLSDEGELTTDDGGVAGSELVVTRRPISRAINCTASVLRRDETQGAVLVLLELSACCGGKSEASLEAVSRSDSTSSSPRQAAEAGKEGCAKGQIPKANWIA